MDYSLLPKIDRVILALEEEARSESGAYNHALLLEAAREAVSALREGGGSNAGLNREALFQLALTEAKAAYARLNRPALRRVINATGVALHTNLGRAPLADEAARAVHSVAEGYCNLELDLSTGKRGSRYAHVSSLLCQLTGAGDALVVNNNAAAVLLCLSALARGGEAVVSRGQLVEIGGSFRIPDIMAISGATLHEVGTTNKTHAYDYANAINDKTKVLLQVHPSNFVLSGFVASVDTADLAEIAHSHALPLLYDLGSGALYPYAAQSIGNEPLPLSLLAAGVDVLTFSGDKLLGGPQAGIIVGKKEFIARIKADPLARALRVDKFTVAALEATLRIYREGAAREKIPAVAMITASREELAARAKRLYQLLLPGAGEDNYLLTLRETESPVGGGSLPGIMLPTLAVELSPRRMSASALILRLLASQETALLAYIHEEKLCFDPRTIDDNEIELAAALISAAVEGGA